MYRSYLCPRWVKFATYVAMKVGLGNHFSSAITGIDTAPPTSKHTRSRLRCTHPMSTESFNVFFG